MIALAQDPIIRAARRKMLTAATHYARAIRELKATMTMLKKHPDFRLTVRRQKAGGSPREAYTLAWWLHNCCSSALNDSGDEAHEWLREDARPGSAERTMRDFIETDERDRARFAKRKRAA